MKITVAAGAAILLSAMVLALPGCEKQGPLEKAGEKIDDTVEEAGEAIEDATDRN